MILTFLFSFFFKDNLPPTFEFKQDKIVAMGQTRQEFSNKLCQDYFLLQSRTQNPSTSAYNTNEQENSYILSYCKDRPLAPSGQWLWFSVGNEKQNSSLPNMYDFEQDYRIFSIGKTSLVVEDKKKQSLHVLSLNQNRTGYQQIKHYKSLPEFIFFELAGNWYMLYPQAAISNSPTPLVNETSYNMISRLPPYMPEIPATAYWTLLDKLIWVKEENLLFFRFQEKWKNSLAAYDLENEQWIFAPPPLLPVSVWKQIQQKKANLLIQINQNVSDKNQVQPNDKVYYEIELDGRTIGKTEIAPDGQELSLLFYIESGQHKIEVIRYVADQENGRYVRDNNIRQLNPISIAPSPERLIYLYTQQGLPADSKPYLLRGVALPMDLN